jgi:hypothetical protein
MLVSQSSFVPSSQMSRGQASLALAARSGLAQKLGVESCNIAIKGFESANFRDSGLDLSSSDEAALMAITPGFVVSFEHDGTNYAYHASNAQPRNGKYAQLPEHGTAIFWEPDSRGIYQAQPDLFG